MEYGGSRPVPQESQRTPECNDAPRQSQSTERIHALIGRRNRWITAACFDIPAGLEIFEYLDDCDCGELD